jgi:peptide/nickel transport system substrate-binding protein
VIAAVESEEVDMLYESLGDFIEIFDTFGWEKSEAVTAATVCIRTNQAAEINGSKPYADVRVRRALQLAVDNEVLLALGSAGNGTVAANHHVCPIHPEYADIGPAQRDLDEAKRLMEDAGMADFEHELISIDDTWRKATCDAAAEQMREAGFKVKRTIMPASTFWNDWTKYPFSATDWAHRPLGVQVLQLAYKSGEAWNESAFSNEEFDTLIDEAVTIADADERRALMERIQTILREEGVVIQPYWRSIFRHAKPGIIGAEQHPAYEIHIYKLGLAA